VLLQRVRAPWKRSRAYGPGAVVPLKHVCPRRHSRSQRPDLERPQRPDAEAEAEPPPPLSDAVQAALAALMARMRAQLPEFSARQLALAADALAQLGRLPDVDLAVALTELARAVDADFAERLAPAAGEPGGAAPQGLGYSTPDRGSVSARDIGNLVYALARLGQGGAKRERRAQRRAAGAAGSAQGGVEAEGGIPGRGAEAGGRAPAPAGPPGPLPSERLVQRAAARLVALGAGERAGAAGRKGSRGSPAWAIHPRDVCFLLRAWAALRPPRLLPPDALQARTQLLQGSSCRSGVQCGVTFVRLLACCACTAVAHCGGARRRGRSRPACCACSCAGGCLKSNAFGIGTRLAGRKLPSVAAGGGGAPAASSLQACRHRADAQGGRGAGRRRRGERGGARAAAHRQELAADGRADAGAGGGRDGHGAGRRLAAAQPAEQARGGRQAAPSVRPARRPLAPPVAAFLTRRAVNNGQPRPVLSDAPRRRAHAPRSPRAAPLIAPRQRLQPRQSECRGARSVFESGEQSRRVYEELLPPLLADLAAELPLCKTWQIATLAVAVAEVRAAGLGRGARGRVGSSLGRAVARGCGPGRGAAVMHAGLANPGPCP